jgi:hypothetical protein
MTYQEMKESPDLAVAAGIGLMKRRYPKDWRKRVQTVTKAAMKALSRRRRAD